MNRVFFILAFLVTLCVLAAPVLLSMNHHDDGLASEHAVCDGDCGCPCHAGVAGIVKTDSHHVIHSVAPVTDLSVSFRILSVDGSIDRPPKQFS
jgi:hypothetical protein